MVDESSPEIERNCEVYSFFHLSRLAQVDRAKEPKPERICHHPTSNRSFKAFPSFLSLISSSASCIWLHVISGD